MRHTNAAARTMHRAKLEARGVTASDVIPLADARCASKGQADHAYTRLVSGAAMYSLLPIPTCDCVELMDMSDLCEPWAGGDDVAVEKLGKGDAMYIKGMPSRAKVTLAEWMLTAPVILSTAP